MKFLVSLALPPISLGRDRCIIYTQTKIIAYHYVCYVGIAHRTGIGFLGISFTQSQDDWKQKIRNFMQSCNLFRHCSVELRENIIESRARNTWLAYLQWVKKWQNYANSRNLTSWPASAISVANFLSTVKSQKSVPLAWSALHFVHSFFQGPNPLKAQFCTLTVAASRRKAQPTKAKLPLFSVQVSAVIKHLLKSPNIANLRLAAMISLVFKSSLRINECLSLNCGDVLFGRNHCRVIIKAGKTDRNMDGQNGIFAISNSVNCPARLIRLYAKKLSRRLYPQEPLFQQSDAQRVTYSQARKEFLRVLTLAGFNAKDFGWHSLRRGATSQALAKGVPSDIVQQNGRWRSIEGMAPYIKLPLNSRLLPSKALD